MIPYRSPLPWLALILVLVLGPLLSACSPQAPGATPTPTKTPRAPEAATVVPFTETAPAADLTPSPETATTPDIESTNTAELSPSATPAPPDDPTATQTVPAAGDPAGPLMASPDFGAQAFLWWREEVADRDLQLIRDAGFRWVKQYFSWQDIEGAGKGQFDWTRTDRIVDQVQRFGLKLIVRVSANPDRPFWGGNPPENLQDFADFAGQVAARYKGRIHAYQVWNEPNLAREWGGKRPDPEGYARMLQATYSAIKAADPDAIVVTAGMAPTGTDSEVAMPDIKFYDLLYQAIGGNSDGYFDMLGAHAAGFAAPPEVSPDEAAADEARYGGERFFTFRHLEEVREVMVRHGDEDKRIVILEFGWTTDPRQGSDYYWHGAGAGIDEALKGKYLVRAFQYAAENWQPWIGLMVVIYIPDINWTKEDEQYWWSIIGPGYPDLYLRAAYVELCIYLNGLQGNRCPVDPNPQ